LGRPHPANTHVGKSESDVSIARDKRGVGSTSVVVANYRVVALIERPLLHQQSHSGGRERERVGEREREREEKRERKRKRERERVCV